MKVICSIILAMTLMGCGATIPREQDTVVKFKYIVNTIPEETLTIPPHIPSPPEPSTDQDIANWLLDGEKRSLDIESKLRSIKKLQADRLEELKKLPKDDVILK